MRDASGNIVPDPNGRPTTVFSSGQLSFGQTIDPTINAKGILVPDYTWKIVVVLQPGQGIADITVSTQVIAIITPNTPKLADRPEDNPRSYTLPNGRVLQITRWDDWRRWRVSVNDLEAITGYDFLSNVPEEIQNIIEADDFSTLLEPLYVPTPLSTPALTASSAFPFLISDNSVSDNSPVRHDGIISRANSQGVFFHDGIPEIGIMQAGIIQVGSPEISAFQVSPFQATFSQTDPFEVSTPEVGSLQTRERQVSLTQVGFNQNSITQVGFKYNGTTQISPFQVGTTQSSIAQLGIPQNGMPKVNSLQKSISQVSTAQVSTAQVSTAQVNPPQANASEIPLSSSVSSKQLFSVHTSTPESIHTLNNSALALWNSLLKTQTEFDINLVVLDLPPGQLAEAQITKVDKQGRPIGGTILIDPDANGKGWFIDPTPLEHTEFNSSLSESAFRASTDSAAEGQYDLLTALLHEMGHLAGFIDCYSGFDRHIQTINGSQLFVTPDFTVPLVSDHLDPAVYPIDLLNPILSPGVRKLPSTLDAQILNAIRNNTVPG